MEQTKALTLPDEQQFKADLVAITKFQQACQKLMLKGHDYGVIPGTQKPTLLKPGAEKITKILGLSDTYEVTQRTEDWDRGFFHYEVKCTLTHLGSGIVISEGLGSCNSMESKYRYRWLWNSELPPDFDKEKAVKRWVTLKSGSKSPQFRIDNEDIHSQVNTLLKMAEKRSLVDAALHAGRLSDLFTQDIEDISDKVITEAEHKEVKEEPSVDEQDAKRVFEPYESESKPKEHWCQEHNCAYEEKKSRYGSFWAHKTDDPKYPTGWCNEKKKKNSAPEPAPEPEPQKPARDPATIKTINELYKACNEDFKLQPAQVIAELGVNSQSDISDTPADCYRRIAAVR